MNKILMCIGALAISIGFIFLDLLIGLQIYGLTMMPLGAPSIGMLQLFGIGLFASYCTAGTQMAVVMIDNDSPKEELSTRLLKALGRNIGKTIAILVTWGLAALIL